MSSDLGVVRSELGDLLAADPARPHEAPPSERELDQTERRSLEPGGSPGAGFGAAVGGVDARQVGDGRESPGGRNQGSGASSEGLKREHLTSDRDPLTGHPGALGLMTLAASESGGRAGPGSSGTESGGRGGPGSSDALGESATPAVPVRREVVVGQPGVNPSAAQLAFATGSPDAADRASGASPYSVDIHESAVASSAFGPVLSGSGGSDYRGGAAAGATAGREDTAQPMPTPDSWSGHTASEGGDQANGTAPDLSKTNELLQQLLDEVRKGRQPFLPVNDRNSSV